MKERTLNCQVLFQLIIIPLLLFFWAYGELSFSNHYLHSHPQNKLLASYDRYLFSTEQFGEFFSRSMREIWSECRRVTFLTTARERTGREKEESRTVIWARVLLILSMHRKPDGCAISLKLHYFWTLCWATSSPLLFLFFLAMDAIRFCAATSRTAWLFISRFTLALCSHFSHLLPPSLCNLLSLADLL